MDRRKVASIFGDTGPIEEHLRVVATERELPDLAIAICTLRFEEAASALRGVLVKAAEGESLPEEEAMLLFRGLHILGGARDLETFQPLLQLLRRPEPELDYLLGDAITESLAKIVAGVFDGDTDRLFDAICDLTIDEFVREALLGAATFLTWEGRIPRNRMQLFLERFYKERLCTDGDQAWIGWLQAIALLGMTNLAPLVRLAWREQRVPVDFMDQGDFESDLSAAERAPDDIGRFKRAHLGYVDDVLEALEWTRGIQDWTEESERASSWTDLPPLAAPVVNPWRYVGRNDPCPCGSGKKAKNCCLGT